MNLSLLDIKGELLVVSQFTLYGDARKGADLLLSKPPRPPKRIGFMNFSSPKRGKQISKVETGRFQAMMDVELVNDGPVTILLDSDEAFLENRTSSDRLNKSMKTLNLFYSDAFLFAFRL